MLSEWGLELDDSCLRLDGRNLGPETIFLNRGKSFLTNDACDWTRQLSDNVLGPVKIDNWILVCTDRDSGKSQDFTKTLLDLGGRMGIKIVPPKLIVLQNDRSDTYINRIKDEINRDVNLELFLCLFSFSKMIFFFL